MKAIRLHARGGPESLRFEDAPSRVPARARCSSGSRRRRHPDRTAVGADLDDTDGEPRPLPVIPGHEFSGEIAALGAGVTDVGVGDLVYGLNDWYRDGA